MRTAKFASILSTMALISCSGPKEPPVVSKVKKEAFGSTASGQPIDIYTLRNAAGFEARIMSYGGIVVSLKTPDRNGQFADVTLGFDSVTGYTGTHPYFGALVGRYGNRIANGTFQINQVSYILAKNNGVNALHGGERGFDKRVWAVQEVTSSPDPAIELTYVSGDGEEGYPGNLTTTVRYTVTPANELRIEYNATTDRDTVLNLTNHAYFNLKGSGDILKHEMQIAADRFTPIDDGLIPTGELKAVKGTPFDFTAAKAIGKDINANDEQIKRGKGYDHNFVLNQEPGKVGLAARVREPETGRVMEVHTDQPGVQFYSGNFLDGSIKGKGGAVYEQRAGFCLETQHFPDSPNKPDFPTTLLKPGETFKSTTVYKFSAEK
ncbi:MAG: galactose mutarotase [Acidobacteria bacterium]|nr:galactose mutarotase [Acidobacteriota bacterium]